MEHSKTYKKILPNNTEVTIKIDVEIKNYNKSDHKDAFGSFGECSRNFYLKELPLIMNTD